jgi:hypothetical protein
VLKGNPAKRATQDRPSTVVSGTVLALVRGGGDSWRAPHRPLPARETVGYLGGMFFRRASVVAALLFFFSASLQFNDPDPIQWIAIYTAAAMVSAVAAGRPRSLPWLVPALVGAVALVWGAFIARIAVGKIPLTSMFRSWEMHDLVVEENRESFGLFIVAAWMAIVAVLCARARRAAPAPAKTKGES